MGYNVPMQRAFLHAVLYVIAFLAVPIYGGAHGAAELSNEANGYRIELSAETLTPETRTPLRYNFDLFSATTSEQMEGRYDRVWVRVMRGDDFLFSTWLAKPEGLLPGFTYAFPEPGDYEIAVRFAHGEKTLAETIFAVTVSGTTGTRPSFAYLFLVSGVGFLMGAILARRFSVHANTRNETPA